jgi:hypothetical protein
MSPKGLYERVVKLLGNNGVTDLTVLIGYFSKMSLTLMFYDVPSFAGGFEAVTGESVHCELLIRNENRT